MRRESKRAKTRRTLLTGAGFGLAAGVLVTFVAARTVIERQEEELAAENAQLKQANDELALQAVKVDAVTDSAELLAGDSDGWCLALVNEGHPLDTEYTPAELTEIDSERSVDSRIAESLQNMLDDGAAAGLSMYVASAYRSYDKQRDVFNSTMQDWISRGYTPLNAYDETKKSVAVPGASEHATGLAVDIISSEYEELDDRQGDTDEQKWLMEHCWEYGFILRYPEEKADITGIIYEPWHYRYVGEEAAKEITEQGGTLEEYILGQ
ncbi:MAG TPA: D-alanyl-D-alanine carboxypeptidase family protein [Candidatus Mediterraneibacter norfolkensis]|nr:D-alanyl-D-alanine carboxypeptidase family protein [Candidatus Mediterraneibacter norfolkensis]